jgi:hypothetical protein
VIVVNEDTQSTTTNENTEFGQATDPVSDTQTGAETQTSGESTQTGTDGQLTPEESTQTQIVTLVETSKGSISVVHDITLGDIIISTILMAILIFQVLSRFIRR